MWVDYPSLIQESAKQLAEQQRGLRGQPTAVRLRMLWLLKSRRVRSLRAAAPLLGYHVNQLQRWWSSYRRGGLAALRQYRRAPGRKSRLTAAAWQGLQQQLRAGRIGRLEDARQYLARQHGIAYQSLNGVWVLLRRLGVRLKTGRRRHQQADARQQGRFKKTSARG